VGVSNSLAGKLADKFDGVIWKGVIKARDEAIDRTGLPRELKVVFKFMVRNSKEYVTFCLAEKKKPNDLANLQKFLLKKGIVTSSMIAKLTRSEYGEAVTELVDLLAGLTKNVQLMSGAAVTGIGAVPGMVAGFGMILLDASDVVFALPEAQQAYYEFDKWLSKP